MSNSLIQEAQEAGHMAVIMPEVEFPGLLVWVGFFRKRFVPVVVVAEVLGRFPLLMPAIVGHRSPGDLEREQTQHDEYKKTSHGQHYNYCGLNLSMTKWVEM